MANATLADLQTWIETYAGPIIDAAMYLVDTGINGQGGGIIAPSNTSERTPLTELAQRVAAARQAGNLPAPYTSMRSASPVIVGQDWAAAIANWLVTWNYPNW